MDKIFATSDPNHVTVVAFLGLMACALVLGAMIGALAPSAASIIPIAGFGAAIVAAATRHRREIRLGPFLAAGYVVAIAVTVARPDLFDSSYAAAVSGG